VPVKGEELANAVALLDAVSLDAGAWATLFLGAELLFKGGSSAAESGTILAGSLCDSPLLVVGWESSASGLSGRLVVAAEVESSGALSFSSPPGVSVVCETPSLLRVELGGAGAPETACFDFAASGVRGSGPALAAT